MEVVETIVSIPCDRNWGLMRKVGVQEARGGFVGLQPAGVEQESVDFVGEDQLLELDMLFAQRLREADGFAEGHVAVVVAVYEQDRRSPGVDGRHGR